MDYKMILDRNIGQNIYKNVDNVEKIREAVTEEIKPEESSENIYLNTVFKVQLAASSNKIEPKSFNFKGLPQISREKEGKYFKYFYGHTSDYNEVKYLVEVAKTKGYPSCFIVAYQNGKRVEVSEVLKSTSN